MKSPVVRLKIRVRLPDGSRPYLDPVLSTNKKLKPLFALVNGQPEHHPEGVYHLRYVKGKKRIWEKVGSDAQYALTVKTKRENLMRAVSEGVPVEQDVVESGPLLTEAIDDFLSETRDQKSKRTLAAYTLALNLFKESCHKKYVTEVERKDMMAFMVFLKEHGNGSRTIANRIAYVKCFLRQFDVVGLLKKKDLPKYTQKRVSAYRPEEVRRLLSVASTEESELIQFFLCTGARDQEVQFATWRDVDFDSKTFMVREKLDLSFTPKDKEEGTIPIPDFLVDMLKARKLRHPNTRLIFPGRTATKTDGHFLRVIKRLALKAELNCGECFNKRGQSCSTHAICSRFKLHKLRKTFATFHSSNGVPVRTIQQWCRHSSLTTTLLYLADSDTGSAQTRTMVNGTFTVLSLEGESPTQKDFVTSADPGPHEAVQLPGS